MKLKENVKVLSARVSEHKAAKQPVDNNVVCNIHHDMTYNSYSTVIRDDGSLHFSQVK